MKFLHRYILICVCVLACIRVSYAQNEPPPTDANMPSPEQIAEGEVAGEAVPAQQSDTSTELVPETYVTPTIAIYKHFRFQDGEDYLPGPTPTPLFDVDAEAKKLIGEAIESVKKDMPPFEQVLKGAFEAPELDKCKEDRSDNVPMSESFPEGLEGENSPAYDLLFIDENDIPEDYNTIFGITTLIVPFVKSVPNIGWELISDMGVPCIPYRIRFQKNRVYVDSGLNALKNFSKGPNGQFHPFIKAKYNIK